MRYFLLGLWIQLRHDFKEFYCDMRNLGVYEANKKRFANHCKPLQPKDLH